MKKLFSLWVVLSLLLSACGSEETSSDGSTSDSDEPYFYTYKTAEFQMEVPETWELVDSFTSEYPEGLRVAFLNDVKDSVFTANVTILKEENSGDDTSYDFAQKKLADHEDTLINYELIEQESITLEVAGAESKSILSTFEGKNETAGPSLIFQQVSLVKGENAWTVTATYRSGEDEFAIETMETMLRSFILR